MNRISVEIIFFVLLILTLVNGREGFYKDVFNDMGTGLSGPRTVPAIAYIGANEEGIQIDKDKELQSSIMAGNENDANGVLLYPDGEPRFALIYSHGGIMSHSRDLGEEGRKRVRDHYFNGGAHVGSCAGSYMLTTMSSTYYRIWGGSIDMKDFNAANTRIEAEIPDGSPLLKYGYDFGGDQKVSNVFLNRGGAVLLSNTNNPVPEGTEILALYGNVEANTKMNGHGSVWAWKDSVQTGRVVGVCPHPEGSGSGEIRDFMAACLKHGLAGIAPHDIKRQLKNGDKITMDKETADNDPLNTKIGDLQYHHFTITVPKTGYRNVKISLTGEKGYDFHLFATKGKYAFKGEATHEKIGDGSFKELKLENLDEGTWYIGVKCATTIESTKKANGKDSYYEYSGPVEVLNGVEYSLETSWDEVGILGKEKQLTRQQLSVDKIKGQHYLIKTGSLKVDDLKIFNAHGKLVYSPSSVNKSKYLWRPKVRGMYFMKVNTAQGLLTKRITIMN